jgi:hypothetical protein
MMVTVVAVCLGLLASGCFEGDGSRWFENDTDSTVWVAHNRRGAAGFDLNMLGWTEVGAHEEAVYSTGGCVAVGEIVVATAPAEESIIDRRVIAPPNQDADDPLCSEWVWSGVGDHD